MSDDLARLAAGLTDKQREAVMSIHHGFAAGSRFRLNEGVHSSPYTALVKAGALGRERLGDFHTQYWLTPLGLSLRRYLKEQADEQ